MTTVSRASRGARMRRHDSDTRPVCEALPQRVRGSRTVTFRGVTPRPAACRSMASSILERASSRSHASTTTTSGRASPGARWMTSSSSNRTTLERRAPPTAGTTRIGTTRPSSRIDPPSRAPPRAASVGSDIRVAGEVAADPWLALLKEFARPVVRRPPVPERVAGTVTTTPRSGWMTTRRPRARVECRSVYGEGPARERRDRRRLRGRRAAARARAVIRPAATAGRRARRSRAPRAPLRSR